MVIEIQVQVYISRDTLQLPLVTVLPHPNLIGKLWAGVSVVGVPDIYTGKFGQVIAEIAQHPIAVDGWLIACVRNGLAKGSVTLCHGILFDFVRPCGAEVHVVDVLPIVGHIQGDVIVLDELEQIFGLCLGLFGRDGLGEEIDAHLQFVFQRLLDILSEPLVLCQLSLGIPSVAHLDHGKVHLLGNFLPVDLPLVGRYIDTSQVFSTGVYHLAVRLLGKVGCVQGVFRHIWVDGH